MSRFEDAQALVGKKVRLDTENVTAIGTLHDVYEDGKLYLTVMDEDIVVSFAVNDEDVLGLVEVVPTFREKLDALPDGARLVSVSNDDVVYFKANNLWYREGVSGSDSTRYSAQYWKVLDA